MVVHLDAVVADATVVATRRTPDVAGFAVFDGYFHGGGGGGEGFDEEPSGCGRGESKRIFGWWGWREFVKVAGEDLK
jgi:hypothetical protein